MTRAEAIKILINYGENNIIARTKVGIAFDMAIKSLETDEAYQLEYERTTKENLADAEDCINRDGAIKALGYDIKHFEFKSGVSKHMDDIAKLLNTIYETQVNNIKALPSVTPQEPILDKIRAEIIKKYWDCDICKFNGRFNIRGDINDILQIIDKYKSESEPQESEG